MIKKKIIRCVFVMSKKLFLEILVSLSCLNLSFVATAVEAPSKNMPVALELESLLQPDFPRDVSITPRSSDFEDLVGETVTTQDPLTKEELRAYLKHHESMYKGGCYSYPLVSYDFCKDEIYEAFGDEQPTNLVSTILDLFSEEDSSEEGSSDEGDEGEMGGKGVVPAPVDLVLIYEMEASLGSQVSHWSPVYFHRSELTDNKLAIMFLDSMGSDSSYVRSLVAPVFVSRSLSVSQKQQLEVFFYKQTRQFDSFSCGLFALNDIRAISSMLFKFKHRGGEHPYLLLSNSGEKEVISIEDNSSFFATKYTTYTLSSFPLPMLQYAQSLSSLEASGAMVEGRYSPLPYVVKVSLEKNSPPKRINGFIALQRKQLRRIEPFELAEEKGGDSDSL